MNKKENQNEFYSPVPYIMVTILICAVLLCVVFSILYNCNNQGWMMSCAITFGVIAYHFFIRFVSPMIIVAVSHKKYDYKSRWFRQKSWEPSLYSLIKVKNWKNKMAMFTFDPREFSTKLHSYDEIINNMCHAELVHELIVLLSFTSLFFAIPFGTFWVFMITAIAAAVLDMSFVILQRYNRPKVVKIIERKEIHQSFD